MELWVRSQDKEILIKCEKIMIEKDRDIFVILNYIDTKNWFRLGYYKTKERALEVLNEIDECMSNAVNSGLNIARYIMPEE